MIHVKFFGLFNNADKPPKLSVRESQQKYTFLYENPDKRLKEDNYMKKISIIKPNLIAIVGSFLPACFFFFFQIQHDLSHFSIPRLSMV